MKSLLIRKLLKANQYTNIHGLPDQVVNALRNDHYDPGESEYSATTLLKPPQQVILERRHGRDEQDVMDNLWSMFGTAVHDVFERSGKENKEAIIEERMYKEVLGCRIGGQVDHYLDGVISDYKVTSVYKVKADDHTEWEQQLNIYANLFEQMKLPVTKLQIVAVLKDWSKNGKLRDKSYPDTPIVVVDLPIWSSERAARFIEGKVKQLQTAESLQDNELPQCTEAEMWYSGTKYAVMKDGNKRATKLYDDGPTALAHAIQLGSKFFVDKREGIHRRCDQYCPVASQCHQLRLREENLS